VYVNISLGEVRLSHRGGEADMGFAPLILGELNYAKRSEVSNTRRKRKCLN
jgi:hypothetical protein